MNFIKTFTLIVTWIFISLTLFAEVQNGEQSKLSLDEGTIDSQFEYVIKKSNNYQEFEVIEKAWMHRLRSHVNDSLKAFGSKLSKSNTTIEDQKAQIEALNSQLSNTISNQEQLEYEKDSMNIFGWLINKTFYNSMMWGVIISLIAILILFIGKFRASNSITKNTRQELEELQYEFDSYRKRALEREQKIKRELQDERNKQLA